MNKIVDSSYKGEKAGIDFGKIVLKFDKTDFEEGTNISYDYRDGVYLRVIELSGNTVVCKILTNNGKDWLPNRYLEPGTEYFTV